MAFLCQKIQSTRDAQGSEKNANEGVRDQEAVSPLQKNRIRAKQELMATKGGRSVRAPPPPPNGEMCFA